MLDSLAMESGTPIYHNLRGHYLFAELPQGEFDRLASDTVVRQLERGEIAFHGGDAADHFFFVDKGLVELNLVSPSGETKVLEVIGAGRTFAEAIAFMREKRYPVTAEILETATLCQISSQTYMAVLHDNPDACIRLLGDISRHLHARVREIENLTVQNARGRLVSYLLDHVAESNGDEATVQLNLPRHVIASRLSVQPETLSRMLRQMGDDDLISVNDRIIHVHSLSRLRTCS